MRIACSKSFIHKLSLINCCLIFKNENSFAVAFHNSWFQLCFALTWPTAAIYLSFLFAHLQLSTFVFGHSLYILRFYVPFFQYLPYNVLTIYMPAVVVVCPVATSGFYGCCDSFNCCGVVLSMTTSMMSMTTTTGKRMAG